MATQFRLHFGRIVPDNQKIQKINKVVSGKRPAIFFAESAVNATSNTAIRAVKAYIAFCSDFPIIVIVCIFSNQINIHKIAVRSIRFGLKLPGDACIDKNERLVSEFRLILLSRCGPKLKVLMHTAASKRMTGPVGRRFEERFEIVNLKFKLDLLFVCKC